MPRKLIRIIGKTFIPSSIKPFARKLYYQISNLVKYGDPYFFNAVDIETITACNRRCSWCPNSIYDRGLIKNKKLMDEKLFSKIIDELSELKFSGQIRFSFYGEPLLDERLNGFVKYTRGKLPKVDIFVFTNGDFLTLNLYKALSKNGVDFFIMTQHDETISPTMKELLKNFHKISYNKKDFSHKFAYKLNGYDTTILHKSIKSMKLCSRGGLLKNIKPKKLTHLKCFLPTNCVVINHTGNVILCCDDYLGSIKFGNLKNESILEIWQKESSKKIRKELREGILRLEICKKCKGVTEKES